MSLNQSEVDSLAAGYAAGFISIDMLQEELEPDEVAYVIKCSKHLESKPSETENVIDIVLESD
jgi:hypothetical protein